MKLVSLLHVALLALGMQFVYAIPVWAQSTVKKTDTSGETSAVKKNAWAVNCGGGQTGGGLVCRMVQNVIIAKTKQRLVSVIIQPAQNAKNHALLVAMPHGLNIPAGVELQVDGQKSSTFAIKTSDQNGTYASEPIDDVMLASLRKGSQLKISYTFANGKKIAIPIGLQGFTAAYKKLAQK